MRPYSYRTRAAHAGFRYDMICKDMYVMSASTLAEQVMAIVNPDPRLVPLEGIDEPYKRTMLKMKPTTSASASRSQSARSARSRDHARPRAGPQAASSPRPIRRPPKARAATWTSRSEHHRREGPSQSKGQLPPKTHIGDEWSQPPWQPPQGALSAQISPSHDPSDEPERLRLGPLSLVVLVARS